MTNFLLLITTELTQFLQTVLHADTITNRSRSICLQYFIFKYQFTPFLFHNTITMQNHCSLKLKVLFSLSTFKRSTKNSPSKTYVNLALRNSENNEMKRFIKSTKNSFFKRN
jgi:hypothetical protein